MPKRVKELSDVKLRSEVAKAGAGPRLIAAGGAIGLHLQVRDNTRSWILRSLTADGKPRRRDLG